MFFTPEPPALSVALNASVTSPLFQPAALGATDGVTVVVGAVLSAGWITNCRLFETMSNCWRPPALPAPMLGSDLLPNSMFDSLLPSPGAYVNNQSRAFT